MAATAPVHTIASGRAVSRGWGFAALLIDSFDPRGVKEVCNQGRLVPPEAQARDGFDGAAYLRTASGVRAAPSYPSRACASGGTSCP